MKEFDVVAVDNGYDFVKGVVEQEGTLAKVKFPSLTYELPNCNISDEKRFSKKRMVVEFEGVEYAIGNYAYSQDDSAGDKDFKDQKFTEPSEKAKLIAAIALLSGKEKEVSIEKLSVGLNIENYDAYQKRFKSIYSNKTFNYKLPGDKTTRSIEIQDVECLPQGIGAFYYFNQSTNLINDDDWIGILDIGGRSVDGFVVDAELGDIVKGTDLGFNEGTSKAFKKVRDDVDKSAPYNYIAKKFREGKKTITWGNNNEKHEIQNRCQRALANQANSIANKVINEWDDNFNRMTRIILCGGGGKDLVEYLRDELSIDIVSGDHPQFSNAFGYFQYAKESLMR